MKILGIESSADETAAAIVEDGHRLLGNVVASSLDLHSVYGGIVPEIAARSHLEVINPVIQEALTQSGMSWDQIDAIAVTYGPGLGGSLLTGVLTARTLAIVKDKPLIPINHVEAHIYSNFITETSLALSANYQLPSTAPEFPILALVVSGGHSQLVLLKNHGDYNVLGRTLDDAVGEAFDKVAKILGLPYPGGPSVAEAAEAGNPLAFKFPKAKQRPVRPLYAESMQGAVEQRTEPYLQYGEGVAEPATQQRPARTRGAASSARRQSGAVQGLGPYDFSFSGLKTAVLRAAQAAVGKDFTLPSSLLPGLLNAAQKADLAASFQRTALETLVDALEMAVNNYNPASVVIGGGVAANQELRKLIAERLRREISYADIKLCTDNAAMIAALAFYHQGQSANAYALEVETNLVM
jgi:N6-L-threonylcarbamoyladenine synthase